MKSHEDYQARLQALAYLEQNTVMTLATYGPRGLWAAAVFYASKEFELIFLSAEHTRHCQNLAANPDVAATIQGDYGDWQIIKGIQLEGSVQLLTGESRSTAIDHYRQKYSFIDSPADPIKAALDRVQWYRLLPERLYFIDNNKGFGHRDEISVS